MAVITTVTGDETEDGLRCVLILHSVAVSQVYRFSGVRVAAGSSMDVTV